MDSKNVYTIAAPKSCGLNFASQLYSIERNIIVKTEDRVCNLRDFSWAGQILQAYMIKKAL